MFDPYAYLDRLHYTGSPAREIETLNALHLAHLITIPYENLSIIAGEPFSLDEAALFDKMVSRRRACCVNQAIVSIWSRREFSGWTATLDRISIMQL